MTLAVYINKTERLEYRIILYSAKFSRICNFQNFAETIFPPPSAHACAIRKNGLVHDGATAPRPV